MAKSGFRGGFPGGGNQMNMMKQAQKMQQDFLKMQQELESKEFEFTAGGGAVKATMVGTRQLSSIVIDLMKKYQAQQAILFGSYARHEADEQSDIDLLVIGGPGFRPTNVFAMAEELHQITGKPVDVYELREIDQNSAFYRNIIHEGITIAA